MASPFDSILNPFGGDGSPMPKPKVKPKPKRTVASDKAVIRAARAVGATTTRTAPTVVRAVQRRVAQSPRSAHDAVISRIDAIASAAATPPPKLTAAQAKLAAQVRAAYVARPGDNLLGGRLERISQKADPAVTLTEKLTRPFTTPQVVAGSLIAGDPVNAAKNLVSASYWGKNQFPSEALHNRGLLTGDSASSLLLGLGADVAPSFAIPGLKGAGRASNLRAVRGVSRVQRLPLSMNAPVHRAQTEARVPGRQAPRPQRAARLRPNVGPDITVNPLAPTARMNPVEPGVTRGGRSRVHGAPRTPLEQMPYAPTVRAARALDEFRQARQAHEEATARQPTRLRAAGAGRLQGKAQEALAASERAAIRKIRRTPVASDVFDLRPQTVGELRSTGATPAEGPAITGLRTRVEKATGKVGELTQPMATVAQAARAGEALAKAQERVTSAEKAMWKGLAEVKRLKVEPTGRQREIHTGMFTRSHEREWITANMDVEAAGRAASSEAPFGINITGPWNRRSKGVTIPFTTKAAAQRARAAFNNGPAGEALAAYRTFVVSRYGPNPVARMGAIAADDVTRMRSGETAKFIRDETKGAKLTEKELELASAYTEGTVRGPVPEKVKAYAKKMSEFTEANFDEFIQAGGQVKRFGQKGLEGGLDRQYVYHLLPPGEWDKFAASALARRQMLYGKRPGFTKRREALTIEALKKAGYHPVERLDELTLARAMAHHRALAEMELSRAVAKRFGKPSEDAPDGWQRIPSQFVDENTMVPPDVAQTLRNVIESRLVTGNKASRNLQRANQSWKEWTLLTTGHDIRNQLGDSALTFQTTANPVAPLLALAHGAKTLTGKGKVGGKSRITSAQAKRLAETSGQRQAGLFGGDILHDVASVEHGSTAKAKPGGVRHPIRSALRGVRFARTGREGVNRTGVMVRELRKGEGAVYASRVAKETLFDYGDVGKAVHWARRSPIGAPFITWTAKNLPRQVRLAIENPAQLSATIAGLESLNQQTGDWPKFLQPNYRRQAVPIPIPGFGNTDVGLPVASLNMLPSDTSHLGDVGRTWYQQMSPLMQAPIALSGTDPLTGNKFDDINGGLKRANPVEEFMQRFPLTRYILGPPSKIIARDAQGNKVPAAAVSSRGAWTLGQVMPGLATVGRLTAGTSGTTIDQARLGYTRRPFFDPVTAASTLRQTGYRVTRELIPDFNARMKAEAPDWRKGDPIPSSLQGKYDEIIRLTKQATIIVALLKANQSATP